MERIGLEPGSDVGGYLVVAPLGAGAMGSVYRAQDADGNDVALKVLHPSVASDPAAQARLRREIAVLTKVRHPGVAHVIDAESDPASDQLFLVTELIEGPTLEQEIRAGGPLDPADVAALARRSFEALQAVHDAGVVHRDLKASNVILGGDGPALIDFGIAQADGDARLTSTGLVMGTPAYLAPELVEGADPSPETDWWSWAALLAFASTGREPFGVRPVDVVLARARAGTPDLAGLSERATVALARALDPDKARRATPEQTLAQLELVAAGDTVLSDEERAAARAAMPQSFAPAPRGAVTEVVAPAAFIPGAGGTRVLPVAAAEAPDGAGVRHGSLDAEGNLRYDLSELPYQRPYLRRRSWTALALGLVITAYGATWPGRALLALLVVLVVCRFAGVAWISFHGTRELKGVRGNDQTMAWVRAPWHAVRTVVGLVPSLIFSAAAVFATAGVAWWALDNNKVPFAGDPPAEGAYQVVVTAAVALVVLLTWFGPLTLVTRTGGRYVLERFVPHGWPVVAWWVVCLIAAGILTLIAFGDQPVSWWPAVPPPSLAG